MESTEPRDRFPQLFAGLTLLSASLIASSFLWAGAIRNIKRVDDALLITGSAKRPIKSDYIVWKVSLSSQQPTTQAAYQELKTRIATSSTLSQRCQGTRVGNFPRLARNSRTSRINQRQGNW